MCSENRVYSELCMPIDNKIINKINYIIIIIIIIIIVTYYTIVNNS